MVVCVRAVTTKGCGRWRVRAVTTTGFERWRVRPGGACVSVGSRAHLDAGGEISSTVIPQIQHKAVGALVPKRAPRSSKELGSLLVERRDTHVAYPGARRADGAVDLAAHLALHGDDAQTLPAEHVSLTM